MLPQQIIHRDPNPGNIILSDDNWGILDFDLSEKNIRIFDPCYAATAILSESFENDNLDKLSQWVVIYKNILYGYDEVQGFPIMNGRQSHLLLLQTSLFQQHGSLSRKSTKIFMK